MLVYLTKPQALNMMTRTAAEDLERNSVYMNVR
jgi:hypothetical protein